jgi:hypothetical protein
MQNVLFLYLAGTPALIFTAIISYETKEIGVRNFHAMRNAGVTFP